MWRYFILLFLTFSFLQGRSGDYLSVYWSGAQEKDVIVSVNGGQSRLADLEEDIAFNTRMLIEKYGEKVLPAGFRKDVRKKRLENFVVEFIYKELLVQKAVADKAILDQPTVELVKAAMARSFGREGETFENVKTRVVQAGYGPYFEKMVAREMLVQSYFSETNQPVLRITDDAVNRYIKRCQEGANHVKSTNEVIRLLAFDLYRRTQAGEDFGDLADRYSQVPNKSPKGFAGSIDKEDFQSMQMEDVWNRLWNLKDGQVLEPINTEATGGWMIYKVLQHRAKNPLTGLPDLQISKILLREFSDVQIPDQESARPRIRAIRLETLKKNVLDGLATNALIVVSHSDVFLSSESQKELKKVFPKTVLK